MQSDTLRVAGIVHDSAVDGPGGLRCCLFLQGCKHACKGCHNPETWSLAGGQDRSISDLEIEIRSSNPDGVTISGGEPLLQPIPLKQLLSKLEPDYNIWLYTGFTWEQIMQSDDMKAVLDFVDVLVDGRFVQELRSIDLLFKGSSNQRIIDVQQSLKLGKVVLFMN